MQRHDLILIIDFGGQYSQLLARRVRESGVYCEVVPYSIKIEKIKQKNPVGLIFSGGPASVLETNAPICDLEIFKLGLPILGICYGMQLMAKIMGGVVAKQDKREYGGVEIKYLENEIFSGMENSTCWMSHTYAVSKTPENFSVIAQTDNCPIAGIVNKNLNFYGLQFHPEVDHTIKGNLIIENFLFKICQAKKNWKMSSFLEEKVKELKEKIGDKKVVCALSGGVDSAVTATLIYKAIGKNLTCVFVDHGLLRKGEAEQVQEVFSNQMKLNLVTIKAQDRFLAKLTRVVDPEKKRKIIGGEFIKIFEEVAQEIGKVNFLAQGTIYPDVIESGFGASAKIKSHHNVGGLPEHIDFDEIIEPLRTLFKDEVRKLGLELGLPESLVMRQPFPGPGLAIRIIGNITQEKLDILREADYIFREEIKRAGLNYKIGQFFAVLTNTKSVGVMGDERTYNNVLAIRAVITTDFMTADWARIPFEVLDIISKRIVNEVEKVGRVVYDITSKPPGTIEWE
jgi:GMP synthase (glutamine-hydrolysing)